MKSIVIVVAICVLTGCSSTGVKDSQWTSCTATDANAGKIEYLNLNGLLMEWSFAKIGFGYLYFSRPLTNDRVWTFPGRTTLSRYKNAIYVADGEVVTAVHRSGRSFEIKIIVQTATSVEVIYREIRQMEDIVA